MPSPETNSKMKNDWPPIHFSSWLNQPTHLKKYLNWENQHLDSEHKARRHLPICQLAQRVASAFSPEGLESVSVAFPPPLGGPTICCWSIRPHIRRHKIPKTHLALLAFGIDASGIPHHKPIPPQKNNPKNTQKRGTLSPFFRIHGTGRYIYLYMMVKPMNFGRNSCRA